MTALENWLRQVTRGLSKDSAAQVGAEIQEHYESAREDLIGGGAALGEAERLALASLGDAQTANRQYRHVLLTSAEARILREGRWEAHMVCSRGWLKYALLVIPAAFLAGAAGMFLAGAIALSGVLFAGALAMGWLFAAPFLRVYTPSRGRIYRRVKWGAFLALFGALLLAFGPNALKQSWLFWPFLWTEWVRASIRRKLPAAKWPRQLYL
jgi:hypothetical protein